MNIDLEKIKAELEKVQALTGEEYYETNKEQIKQEVVANFEKTKQNDINILTAILNTLPNFEAKEEAVKEEQQESQKQSIEENTQTEQTIQS